MYTFLILAATLNPQCVFTQYWADRALSNVASGLQEDRWHISEEGFPKPLHDIIVAIRHEAYHDQPALHRRVKAACAVKVET